MRIFIGTFLSERDCERISQFQQNNSPAAGVKWVKPNKLHMTWSFLGEIEESRISLLSAAVGKAIDNFHSETEEAPLAVTFKLPVFWPDKNHPRHFVLEPAEVSTGTMRLSKMLSQYTAEFKQPGDNLPFRPHVTIARISGRGSSEFKEPHSIIPIELTIDRVAVINSHTAKGDDGYQVLSSFTVSAQA